MMRHYLSIRIVLVLFAALKVHGTWTNVDLQRLNNVPGSISVVGQTSNEASHIVEPPVPEAGVKNPPWYAARAAALNDRLEAEQTDLRKFTLALNHARELKSTTDGVNLAEEDIGITPEATIEILQNRVRETQSELGALEDLARQNGIPPGILRGQ